MVGGQLGLIHQFHDASDQSFLGLSEKVRFGESGVWVVIEL